MVPRPYRHRHPLVVIIVAVAVPLLFLVSVARGEQECERLQQSLTYRQEDAPRDLSGVLPVVVERVNRVLDGVVDVEVEWHGDDLHGRVGEHMVKCKVTRLASALKKEPPAAADVEMDEMGRRVVSQCFHVPFTITDTNECTLPMGHAMRHACHSSAICVNTVGSYDCICARLVDNNSDDDHQHYSATTTVANDEFWSQLDKPPRSPWEVSFNTTSRTTCPSMPSTHGCCPERVHSRDGASCRHAFRCPMDPCSTRSSSNGNDCTSTSTCVRKEFPVEEPNYKCQCPAGLMGNGHKCKPGIDPKPNPKVMFDRVTPTEETIKNNFYCGCTAPIVDACSGYPPCKGKHEVCTVSAQNQPSCACKTHYVMHEKYGCVDESPPIMKLKHDVNGDSILRLKQGDVYKEYAVDIQDENAEEYLRSLKIAYSRPLPNGCLTKVGEFHVNYTIATPWTSPPYVRLTRRVIIDDFDECRLVERKSNNNHGLSPAAASYEKTCPELVPRCDYEAGAVCVNTIGSYTCKCPKYTTGDGFQSGLSFGHADDQDETPTGYEGGTGCRDTSTPIISLLGPNPKILRVCECSGVKGILGGNKKDEKDLLLKKQQQKDYGSDIKSMIENTHGAELCATPDKPNPSSSDCVDAYDETYKGKVDLSRKVSVGAPVQKTPLHWAVPYNVQDEAGNRAPTVWRDIIVEEVDLGDVEARVRREALKGRDADIKREVDKALERERREANSRNAARKQQAAPAECPKCRKCDCTAVPGGGVDMEAACDAICDRRAPTCPADGTSMFDDDSLVLFALLWLERFFPPSAVPIILFVMVVFGIISILRWILSLLFYQRSYRPSDYSRYAGREGELRNQVTVFGGGGGDYQNGTPATGARQGAFAGPPRASTSLGGGDGSLFTPSPARHAPTTGVSAASVANGGGGGGVDMDIYANSPRITPSKTGDGVHRQRSPYT